MDQNSTTGKTFEFETLNQICNVANSDNCELIALDFAQWLKFYVEAIENIRKDNPAETDGLSNIEIAECKFIWTDDGINGLTEVMITNPDTGETTRLKIPSNEK